MPGAWRCFRGASGWCSRHPWIQRWQAHPRIQQWQAHPPPGPPQDDGAVPKVGQLGSSPWETPPKTGVLMGRREGIPAGTTMQTAC